MLGYVWNFQCAVCQGSLGIGRQIQKSINFNCIQDLANINSIIGNVAKGPLEQFGTFVVSY